MGCILALLWLPLLVVGGFIGFSIGASIGGEAGALLGGLLGILAAHLIQGALWGDKRPVQAPPIWWNR
jgi:hypothetical protein